MGGDCQTVMAEVQARIEGQYSAWHDPHNKNRYYIGSDGGQPDEEVGSFPGDAVDRDGSTQPFDDRAADGEAEAKPMPVLFR